MCLVRSDRGIHNDSLIWLTEIFYPTNASNFWVEYCGSRTDELFLAIALTFLAPILAILPNYITRNQDQSRDTRLCGSSHVASVVQDPVGVDITDRCT
jgi:hypothetical protein